MRGVREVYERCTRGSREGHKRCIRGVHSWAINGIGNFSFWHTWNTVGTLAPNVHERCTRGAR